MYIFISVNFGTSDLISDWSGAIRRLCTNPKLILVDNFHSELERSLVRDKVREQGIKLVELDNVGYGAALNEGLKRAREDILDVIMEPAIFFASNLDVKFTSLPDCLPNGSLVFVPKITEGRRSRNPFLTKLQRQCLALYSLSALAGSLKIYYCAVILNKVLGIFPSGIWAIHGSLFCFHSSLHDPSNPIFNEKSFLYCEELEFASYMDSAGASYVSSDIKASHTSHVSTEYYTSKMERFFELWQKSYRNWRVRWKK